jgi:hypothetical protein
MHFLRYRPILILDTVVRLIGSLLVNPPGRDKQGQKETFSIISAFYKTSLPWARAVIRSMHRQTYKAWELCIAYCDLSSEVEQFLQKEAANDPRMRLLRLDKNQGISRNQNRAAALASGSILGFLDHDDVLFPSALSRAASALSRRELDVVYTDEIGVGRFGQPFRLPTLKSDFDSTFLLSQNYCCHFVAMCRKLFDSIGGFKEGYEGAQDWDLLMRAMEHGARFGHIRRTLYGWRRHQGSTSAAPVASAKPYAIGSQIKAVADHFRRIGVNASCSPGKAPGLVQTSFAFPECPIRCRVLLRDQSILNSQILPSNLSLSCHQTSLKDSTAVRTADCLLILPDHANALPTDLIKRMVSILFAFDCEGVVGPCVYENGIIARSFLRTSSWGTRYDPYKGYPVNHSGLFGDLIMLKEIAAAPGDFILLKEPRKAGDGALPSRPYSAAGRLLFCPECIATLKGTPTRH